MPNEPKESPPAEATTSTTPSASQTKPSRRGGRGSSEPSRATTSAFVVEPGPAHEPGDVDVDVDEREPIEPVVGDLFVEWEEPQVRTLLEAQGSILHTAIAADKESDEWVYTRTELAAIAPPLTRILNRYDATRAAAGTADELGLMIGLAGYVTRSIKTRREAFAELDELGPQPISGVRADPGTGPGDDVAFSATVGNGSPAPPSEEETPKWDT